MNRLIGMLSTVLPVLLMLGIGILCRTKGMLNRQGIDQLKKVVVNITLPAVLLNAFATTTYTARTIAVPLLMFGVCCLAWLLGKLLGKPVGLTSKYTPFLTTGFECAMLGYALFTMLHGSERVAELAVIDLGAVLFVFTLYKILAGVVNDNGSDARTLFREMMVSPIIISIVVGVLIGATGLYRGLQNLGIAAIFDSCVSFISAPTAAVILLTIGYDLVLSDVKWLPTCKAVGLRFVIMMALRAFLLVILKVLLHETMLTDAVNIMFILPPPFVLPVFVDDPEQRAFFSSVLSVSTLVTIVGFAVLAALA